jgi:hypothetical protein
METATHPLKETTTHPLKETTQTIQTTVKVRKPRTKKVKEVPGFKILHGNFFVSFK